MKLRPAVVLCMTVCICRTPAMAQPRQVAAPHRAPPGSAPVRPADAARAAQLQAAYATRVTTITGEIKPRLAELWTTFEEAKALLGTPAKRVKPAALTADKAQQLARLKVALTATIKDLRVNTRRLRALSPVPRSLRKADNVLVEFSLELDQGLDTLGQWMDTPAYELGLQAGRELRKASTSLDTGLKQLQQRTDPAVQAKVYVDD